MTVMMMKLQAHPSCSLNVSLAISSTLPFLFTINMPDKFVVLIENTDSLLMVLVLQMFVCVLENLSFKDEPFIRLS